MAPRNNKKPKRDSEQLAKIHEVANALLLRELEHYRDSGERVPAALLSSAMAILKVAGVDSELQREADAPSSVEYDEQGAPVTRLGDGRPFVSRLTPEYLAEAGLSEDAGTTAPAADDWTSLAAFCAAHGLTEDDTQNISRLARAAALKLPEGDKQRDAYLVIAREASRRTLSEASAARQ
jgi:hypothetical protein